MKLRLLAVAIALFAVRVAHAEEVITVSSLCVTDYDCGAAEVCDKSVCAEAKSQPRRAPILPFVWAETRHARMTLVVPALLSGFTKDAHAGRWQAVVLGLGFFAHDADRTQASFFPIFFHDRDRRGSVTLVPPLLLFHQEDRLRDYALITVFPIFFYRHEGPARRAILGPLFGYSNREEHSGGGGLFPIVWFGKDKEATTAAIAPLFFLQHKPDQNTVGVGPVFANVHKNGDYNAGLAPLLFFGHSQTSGYAFVPPLFWHHQENGVKTDAFLTGYYRRGSGQSHFGIGPFFFRGHDANEAYTVVPLLFAHVKRADSEELAAGPYFYARDKDRTSHTIIPVAHCHHNAVTGLCISPVGLVKWDKSKNEKVIAAGPFVRRTSGTSTSNVAFPFVAMEHDRDHHTFVIPPIYYQERTKDTSMRAVFPLFLHTNTPTAATTLAGPFWLRNRKDGGESLGVFPLFGYGKHVTKAGTSEWFGMPFLFYGHNGAAKQRQFVLFPFFHFSKKDDFTTTLPPLFAIWRRDERTRMFAPFYFHEHNRETNYTLDVVTLFYVSHRPDTVKVGLVPLFYSRFSKGYSNVSLVPLFYASHRTDGNTLLTFPFGFYTKNEDKRFYIGPIYGRTGPYVKTGALFPLVYAMRDKYSGAQATMVAPLFLDARTSHGTEFQAYSPLIWRIHDIEGSNILGVPLFFDLHRYGERRTTGFLPLFIRHRSMANGSLTHIFPPLLFWMRSRTNPEHAFDMVVAPIFWRFGGEKPTTVFFPIVWDFKRAQSRTTVYAPVGAHWEKPDAAHTLTFNLYIKKGAGPNKGNYYVNYFPLFSFGRPGKNDLQWALFGGLVGYERRNNRRIFEIFWLIDIPLDKQTKQTASFFTSAPSTGTRLDSF